jgi:hypothetical protein
LSLSNLFNIENATSMQSNKTYNFIIFELI